MTLDALRAAFGRVAPEADLQRFFADWLDRPGAPVLEVSWEASGEGLDVVVRQIQESDPYQLLVDVDLVSASGVQRHAVAIDGRVTRARLPSSEDVRDVLVDPDVRLLLWTPDYGPRPATIEVGGRR